MYQILLYTHSLFRWLVLATLLWSVIRAWRGYYTQAVFTKADNALRHWTATIAHVQLVVGMILYTQSPIIKYYWKSDTKTDLPFDLTFFGIVHMLLMLVVIVFITIGSALAKRKPSDTEKFKTMLLWFAIALLLICIAIPWPFSPLAHRPYFR